MSTTEERIARIHERAGEIKKEKELQMIRIGTVASSVMGVLLIALIGILGRGEVSGAAVAAYDNGYAGASLFGSQAGGYIVVALVAFMLGAVVAVLIRTYNDKNKQ